MPGNYSYNYTASDAAGNKASIEIVIRIVEQYKMNTTTTFGPYHDVNDANVAAADYLKQGSERLAVEASFAQVLTASGAGHFTAADVSVVKTEVKETDTETWRVYVTFEVSIANVASPDVGN